MHRRRFAQIAAAMFGGGVVSTSILPGMPESMVATGVREVLGVSWLAPNSHARQLCSAGCLSGTMKAGAIGSFTRMTLYANDRA